MSPNRTGKNKDSDKSKAENSDDKQKIPFHFHAEAHAFSASFIRPDVVPVPAQAPVSLPSIGGSAHSRVDNFRQDALVRFTLAESHVSGSWKNKTIVTT